MSWAGLTPTARQSGPRSGRGKKGHGNTYAKRIAVLAAYAAANTDTFFGERFRRLSSRPGGGGRKKAGCAVGRSILIIVWHLLNDPAARYRDLGPDWHARHTDRSRKARNARRQIVPTGGRTRPASRGNVPRNCVQRVSTRKHRKPDVRLRSSEVQPERNDLGGIASYSDPCPS